jgi:type I restriction enzyme, S subunit
VQVDIDPGSTYATLDIRSFGKGIFHYDPRPGAEIGKLRFFEVGPDLLAISNIKAWEGAVAVTTASDAITVASNRFLFFRPRDGRADIRYLRHKLLMAEGLDALGRASPGSADRNRTLSVRRFEEITLDLPDAVGQRELGAQLERLDQQLMEQGSFARSSGVRLRALQQTVMNKAFAAL